MKKFLLSAGVMCFLSMPAAWAEVSVSLKLVELSSDEYFELNDARLLITDQGFEHLIEDNPS